MSHQTCGIFILGHASDNIHGELCDPAELHKVFFNQVVLGITLFENKQIFCCVNRYCFFIFAKKTSI